VPTCSSPSNGYLVVLSLIPRIPTELVGGAAGFYAMKKYEDYERSEYTARATGEAARNGRCSSRAPLPADDVLSALELTDVSSLSLSGQGKVRSV
jgi:hypothetical protein